MKNIIIPVLILISITAFCQNDQLKTDWANLKKYAGENKNLIPPSKGEKRVVFMGNSITEFWKYNDSSFFINNSYIDRGISGQTTSQMLVRFRPDVIALKPSLVVILAGINDIAENTGPIALEDIFGNIVSMAELAKMNNIKVVISSVLPALSFYWKPEIKPVEKIIRLNAMLSSYCKTHKIIFVDYYSNLVDENKGLDKKFTEDGVHPTLAGYKVMEPMVQQAIKTSLQEKK